MTLLDERRPDGASPFEDHDCGHLPCPPWLEGDVGDEEPVAASPQPEPEPELDAPHHVHDLWAVLGLGETE
jgi:hypothetical protein